MYEEMAFLFILCGVITPLMGLIYMFFKSDGWWSSLVLQHNPWASAILSMRPEAYNPLAAAVRRLAVWFVVLFPFAMWKIGELFIFFTKLIYSYISKLL